MSNVAIRESRIARALFSVLTLSTFAALFGPAVASGFVRLTGPCGNGYGFGYGYAEEQYARKSASIFGVNVANAAEYGYGYGYGYGNPCRGGSGGSGTMMYLSAPNGGETFTVGQHTNIFWTVAVGGVQKVRVTLSLDGGETYPSTIVVQDLNTGYHEWTVPDVHTTTARVKVEALGTGDVLLAQDASDANFTIVGSPETKPEVLGETDTDGSGTFEEGTFVKLPSDNNPATQPDSTVYYVDASGKAHPFVSQPAFLTWYTGFEAVTVVDAATLAAMTASEPILFRPGAAWVKTVGDNKVYYVATGNVLRWVSDEATATALGGANWAANVLDIADSFMTHYTIGEPLTASGLASAWPNAFLGKSGDTTWVVVGNKRRLLATPSAFSGNRFQTRFVQDDATGWQTLPTGTDVTDREDALFDLLP